MIKRREPLALTNIEEVAKAYSKADTEAKAHLAADLTNKEKARKDQALMNSTLAEAQQLGKAGVDGVDDDVDLANYMIVNNIEYNNQEGQDSGAQLQYITSVTIGGKSYLMFLNSMLHAQDGIAANDTSKTPQVILKDAAGGPDLHTFELIGLAPADLEGASIFF